MAHGREAGGVNSIKNRKIPAKTEQPKDERPQLLTEKQACAYLGVSPAFLRRGRSEGQRGKRTDTPRYVRLGERIYYLRSELDRWLSGLRAYSNLAEEGDAING
jgi:predicted DNA-binding transcriptional regulator AlpA